jgi:GAF domain-containing protein
LPSPARWSEGEDEHTLLESVTPWLLEARRNRAVSLRHAPDGAGAIEQRSHLIVPLIVQRDLLGYIYADIDGAFGRFHDGDRDLLAMLASQAAVALANLRFAAGLERKVAERTRRARTAGQRAHDHQQHPAGYCRGAQLPGDRGPGGRQAAGGAEDR